jgi:hypothetical protein
MKLLVVLGLLAGLTFLVDRLLLWIRFDAGQVGPAFLAIQGPVEPETCHAAEELRALRTEGAESGAPPDPLPDRDRERVVVQLDQRP